mmetsp:Transcript_69659/g.167188  ORF Transcript_69659/g.167188 Transcript_69659/m.167188 type:complete len:307 (+) Transcript_69659:168-1088(+)
MSDGNATVTPTDQQEMDDVIFLGPILSAIEAAIESRLDAEVADEVGPMALKQVSHADPGTAESKSVRYCRFVLRGADCPYGQACRFQHFVAHRSGRRGEVAAAKSEVDAEREALSCGLCSNLLKEPVTLPCGHTFDRRCLLRLPYPSYCPVDGKKIPATLPEVDFTVRAYIDLRFSGESCEDQGREQDNEHPDDCGTCTPAACAAAAESEVASDSARAQPPAVQSPPHPKIDQSSRLMTQSLEKALVWIRALPMSSLLAALVLLAAVAVACLGLLSSSVVFGPHSRPEASSLAAHDLDSRTPSGGS